MPVFNAAESQVLFKPVTSYKQGQAFRANMEQAKANLERTKKENKLMDEQHDLDKKKTTLAEKEYDLKAGKYALEVGKDVALREANAIIGITEGAKASDDALAYANERMPEFIASLPEGESRAKLEEMAADGFQAPELAEIHATAMAINKQFGSSSKSKSDYTLGDTRYSGETNLPVATNPKAGGEDDPFAKVNPKDFTPESVAAFEDSGKHSDLVSNADVARLTDRDKRIRDYQTELGLDKETAVKLADDLYTMKINSQSGAVQLIDQIGQTVREIPVERRPTATPTPAKGETLYDMSQYVAGPTNTIAAAMSIPMAWVGMEPPEKIISARQTFATTNQQFIKALANSKRYPVAEVKRILEDIAMVPKFLDDPKLMQTRILALRKTLMVTAEQARQAGDDTGMPADYRGDAKIVAQDIENYLAILGHPEASEASIRALRADPSKLPEFMDKFGYVPEGIE